MNKKRIFLSLLLVLLLVALLYVGLGRHTPPGKTGVSNKIDDSLSPSQTLGPKVSLDKPEEVGEESPQRPSSRRFSRKAADRSPTESKEAPPRVSLEVLPTGPIQGRTAMTPFSVSLEALPTDPVQEESAMKRSLPKAVAPGVGKMPILRLCKGEPISECLDCGFTHGDFALLILDILGLAVTKVYEEAFEILGSLHIRPVDGWAKADPQKLMTPRETEEVRCSISLAHEDGLIQVVPSIVSVGLNGFCREFKVSLRTIEDSGILKSRSHLRAETGYQGGGRTVFSSPF